MPVCGCTFGSGDKQASVEHGQMQSISGCVDVLPDLVSLTVAHLSNSNLQIDSRKRQHLLTLAL